MLNGENPAHTVIIANGMAHFYNFMSFLPDEEHAQYAAKLIVEEIAWHKEWVNPTVVQGDAADVLAVQLRGYPIGELSPSGDVLHQVAYTHKV